MLALTFDADWAPEEVLDDTLALMDSAGLRGTVFCTHPYHSPRLAGHEAALHPNYHDRSRGVEEHLAGLLAHYSAARGVRSHGLVFYPQLARVYAKLGLAYSSDYVMPYQENIAPFQVQGTWQLPIYFADMFWLHGQRGSRPGTEVATEDVNLHGDGLKVFLFHPVHIYLNTPDQAYYEGAKRYYQDPARLLQQRNSSRQGVRDIFLGLLERITAEAAPVSTLCELLPES